MQGQADRATMSSHHHPPASRVPVTSSHHHWEERWRALISGQARGPGAAAARAGLAALAGLYGGVMSAYRGAYDRGLVRRVTAGCRVISVGNLTVGGTGKSTTVRWLAARLRDRGIPVAVISYGYRAGSRDAVTVVSDGHGALAPAAVGGDEPRMLAEALPGVPVLIAKRRQLAAAAAVERFGARVCVLDDAFQYWRLVKDLDLVLVDALCPFGGGHLLPRGLLREAPRQLRRADAVILTNGQRLPNQERRALGEQLRRLSPAAVLAEARHAARPLRRLGARGRGGAGVEEDSPEPPLLVRQRVLALSSLGNPEGFEQMLADRGAEVVPARYPDHHRYRSEELAREAARARQEACALIVTTEKDAVKIDPGWANPTPVWVLPVALEFDAGQAALEARLDVLFGSAGQG
jgi:tetraacyldisaccharide-1-P 4'-kinase